MEEEPEDPNSGPKNLFAALFHSISVMLSCGSLFLMCWFQISACPPYCTKRFYLYQFMKLGHFRTIDPPRTFVRNGLVVSTATRFDYHTENEVLRCVSPELLNLMRVLILLMLLCICYSIIGFCLHVFRPSKEFLRFIRRNALPSILFVLSVMSIIGVSYLVARSLETLAFDVNYGWGFFTIIIAGVITILITLLCNLLYDPPPSLEEYYDDRVSIETSSFGIGSLPPPYTP